MTATHDLFIVKSYSEVWFLSLAGLLIHFWFLACGQNGKYQKTKKKEKQQQKQKPQQLASVLGPQHPAGWSSSWIPTSGPRCCLTLNYRVSNHCVAYWCFHPWRYLKDYLGPHGILRDGKGNEYSNLGLLVRQTGSALSRSGKPWDHLPPSILSCLEGPEILTTQNSL